MTLILQKGLPVIDKLLKEGVDVNCIEYNEKNNINVRIAIVNLMPLKLDAELDLLRRLSKANYNIFVEFIKTTSRESKRECNEYTQKYYKTIDKIQNDYFDGVIITGAPVEQMEFEEVDYWDELKDIMEYSRTKTKSTFHICWAAQAGLYNFYNINKRKLDEKCFGVFEHKVNKDSKIVREFKESFFAPHSRHTTVDINEITQKNDLKVVSYSEDAGAYIIEDNRDIFVMGHSEYNKYTLDNEYKRDLNRGLNIDLPRNYYENDDYKKEPIPKWIEHSELLFKNWVEYYLI
ncbi:MAG: homoserine O-acetyltransferase/O-succinyltransferase family protein [Peptostreptococcaceae bacterium]